MIRWDHMLDFIENRFHTAARCRWACNIHPSIYCIESLWTHTTKIDILNLPASKCLPHQKIYPHTYQTVILKQKTNVKTNLMQTSTFACQNSFATFLHSLQVRRGFQGRNLVAVDDLKKKIKIEYYTYMFQKASFPFTNTNCRCCTIVLISDARYRCTTKYDSSSRE